MFLFLLSANNVYAGGPYRDGFDTYIAGNDVQDNNGGSNWSESWGTTNVCNAVYDTSSAQSVEGGQSMSTGDGTGSCGRFFAEDTTENQIYTFFTRAAQTNVRMDINWQTTAQIVQLGMGNDGQMRAINNAVWDNLGAYSANTWYRFDSQVTGFVGKTFQAGFCDETASADCVPSMSANKTFANNSAATGLTNWTVDGVGSTFFIDEIGGKFVDAVAAPPAPNNKYVPGFMGYLWNTLIQKVYAKN